MLADDHTLLRGVVEKLLAADCEVVGSVGDGRAAVEATEKLLPDVSVLDISMPVLNGLEAGHQIKQRFPSVKLIFVTMNEDPDLAAEAFRSGCVRLPTQAVHGVGTDDRHPGSHVGPLVCRAWYAHPGWWGRSCIPTHTRRPTC